MAENQLVYRRIVARRLHDPIVAVAGVVDVGVRTIAARQCVVAQPSSQDIGIAETNHSIVAAGRCCRQDRLLDIVSRQYPIRKDETFDDTVGIVRELPRYPDRI